MNISGASAWESLRDNLTSSVKVEYNGGVTNLSAIRNLAYDPDPAVRKSAYEAELACYDKIKDSVAFASTASSCRSSTSARSGATPPPWTRPCTRAA